VYFSWVVDPLDGGGDMSPVVTESREALLARRTAILARLGSTPEEFDRVVATHSLTGEELDARDELDEIDFLLGEDRRS
jgi:hypothetical protein